MFPHLYILRPLAIHSFLAPFTGTLDDEPAPNNPSLSLPRVVELPRGCVEEWKGGGTSETIQVRGRVAQYQDGLPPWSDA